MVQKIKHKIKTLPLQKDREMAKNLFREYEAIYTLINAMTVDNRKIISISYDAIDKMDKELLLKNIEKIKAEIDELRIKYGIKADRSGLIKILEAARDTKKGMLLIPKYNIRKLFSNYEKVLIDFDTYPEHTRIGIDIGLYRKIQGKVELFLLETVLFENMCALFNLYKEQHMKLNRQEDSKRLIKTVDSLGRATVTMAFFFVEAYLNGLSADYYLKNENKLDKKDAMLLAEWDFTRKKPRYLSLKDKVLQYPRIILSTQHPPLQENNCQELSFIISRAKDIRDAIVHASSLPNLETYVPGKEEAVFNINYTEVEQVVDNAIILIRKIETTISGNDKRLFWIVGRSADGFFSEETFE